MITSPLLIFFRGNTMTLSIRNPTDNITYDTCAICQENCTDVEKYNTKKIVELACHHFYHMNCINHWFAQNCGKLEYLSCHCKQFSIKKRLSRDFLTPKMVITFLEEVKQDPNYQTDKNVMNCIVELHRLIEPLVALLKDMNSFQDLRRHKYETWIKNNIDTRLQKTADILIKKLFRGFDVAADLQERVNYLSHVPYEKWPMDTEKLGVPVYWIVDKKYVTTSVSKDYLDRAVAVVLRERLQNAEEFDFFLMRSRRDYKHDWQVIEALPYLEELRETFSEALREKPLASKEEILSLLEKKKGEIELDEFDDHLRKTIGLLMDQFLFDRIAVRTLAQEKKRWRKEFLRDPSIIQTLNEKDPTNLRPLVRVLNEKDPTTYDIKNLEQLVSTEDSDSDENEKIHNAIYNILVVSGLVFLATKSIYNWVKRV